MSESIDSEVMHYETERDAFIEVRNHPKRDTLIDYVLSWSIGTVGVSAPFFYLATQINNSEYDPVTIVSANMFMAFCGTVTGIVRYVHDEKIINEGDQQ